MATAAKAKSLDLDPFSDLVFVRLPLGCAAKSEDSHSSGGGCEWRYLVARRLDSVAFLTLVEVWNI